MTATYRVSDAELEAYANDGALLLKSIIDEPWLAQVAEAIERVIDSPRTVLSRLRGRQWARAFPR